jgi:hypothetical protein
MSSAKRPELPQSSSEKQALANARDKTTQIGGGPWLNLRGDTQRIAQIDFPRTFVDINDALNYAREISDTPAKMSKVVYDC